MRLPMSWLREWVEFEGDASRVAECLTMRGFYVEEIETVGHRYPGVVVARVIEVSRHPNADKLSLCRVDGGGEELRVVCGAPNVHAGMIAPLATVGAELPGGVRIRETKIRGEESQGMLCSPRELRLSDEHEGILDLARHFGPGADLRPGRPLDELFPPPEDVLVVEVPFNRPDGLGVLGLAREVRAGLGGQWTAAAKRQRAATWAGRSDFDLILEDTEGCPRYIAQVIDQVRIGPSPPWVVRRLETMGQRSINNLVDLTNLILLGYGQPLHAFDLRKLKGPSIRVRRARDGETITTLDGKARTLNPEVLVIADRQQPVAVAGIMGGAETEVSNDTTAILLECAFFDPRRVRRGSAVLGLSTEASKRYERGVDPEVGSLATANFMQMLRETCLDARPGAARRRDHLEKPVQTLRLRMSRTTRLLGMGVGAEEAARHLEALEFGVDRGDPIAVRVPTWRPDVTIEDDLVEEVGRAHGYDRIPEAAPVALGAAPTRSPRERVILRARAAMRARGLTEAWTTTLISGAEAEATSGLFGDPVPAVRLANPTSREGEVLRPSPVAGLLRACAHNLRQGMPAVRLFEIGNGFEARSGADTLPGESLMLSAVVTGPRLAHGHDAAQQATDFDDAKGLWEAWLEEMSVDTPEWRPYSSRGWKLGASAEVASGTSRIGWAGVLGRETLRGWDIEVPVHLFAVLLEPIAAQAVTVPRASLPSRFPPVRRDVAFFVPESVTHRQLEGVLRGAGGPRLVSIELFDVYAGPGTPQGMKSLAYALQFQDPERTLAETEVQAVQDQMTAAVATQCGGRLREK